MDKQCLTIRNNGLSYSRAIATIAIIALHTGFALSTGWKLDMSDNIISRIFVNCSMWAVPVFIMVTGILNLEPSKVLTLKKLFKKNILRIFVAMAVFIAIYQIVDIILGKQPVNFDQLLIYIKDLYTGMTYSPMWYLYMLIGLYLLMPLYRSFTRVGTDREIRYVLLVYVIFISILPIIGSFGLVSGFYINELTIYPFYMFIGYALNKGIVKLNQKQGLIIFILTTVLLIVLTYYRWAKGYEKLEVFWAYSSFIVIFQSMGIFSMMMGKSSWYEWMEKSTDGNVKRKDNRFLLKLDDCSFGIYLVHIIFIRIYSGSAFVADMIGSITIIPTLLILIAGNLVASYIVVKILKKIPGFKFFLRQKNLIRT